MSEPTRTVTTLAGPREVPGRLHLSEPLPGLPGTEYTLDALDDIGFLFALRGEGDVRLFVVSPCLVFPDYAPTIPGATLEAVGDGEADVVLLAVVHPGPDGRFAPTANLLAPIVVDSTTGRAMQTVLDDDLPLRAPLG